MALKIQPGHNLCFYNPGVDSPLSISRYPWAKRFIKLFDCLFFQSLSKKATCILAAADEPAITDLKRRAGEKLKSKNIISFPTRVDTGIFHPADRFETRRRLGLPADAIIAVTTGRIHWAKGWQFLLESFRAFFTRFPKSLLIFIGDGSERDELLRRAESLGLKEHVIVAGYQSPASIATYLQAANLFVMGSLKEGWSTVLVEALACHVPIVTTPFSSADTIVENGVNGFITERDALKFAKAMESVHALTNAAAYADELIARYALNNLARDLLHVWPLMTECGTHQQETSK